MYFKKSKPKRNYNSKRKVKIEEIDSYQVNFVFVNLIYFHDNCTQILSQDNDPVIKLLALKLILVAYCLIFLTNIWVLIKSKCKAVDISQILFVFFNKD